MADNPRIRELEQKIAQARIRELEQKIGQAKKKKAISEENPLLRQAAFAGASLGAGLVGGLPDLVAAPYNLSSMAANAFGANLPHIPSATDAVRKKIDELTGGYTAPRDALEKDISKGLEFVGGLPTGGPIAKGLGMLGKLPKLAEFASKTSKLNSRNVGGAFGAGVGLQEAQENFPDGLPALIGGVLAPVVGGGLGSYAAKNIASIPTILKAPRTYANHSSVFPKGSLLDREYIDEGRRLENSQGISFTAGELTGDMNIQGVEDALVNTSKGRQFLAEKSKNIDRLEGNYFNFLKKIHPESINSKDIGSKLVSTFKDAVNKAVDFRRERGVTGFGLVDKASQGNPTVEPTNFINQLKEFAAKKTAPGLSELAKEEGQHFTQWFQDLENQLKENNGRMTGEVVQKNLEELTSGSSAVGKFFKDIESAPDRRPAAILKDALLEDVKISASGSASPEIATTLLEARQNYFHDSQIIDKLKKSTIANLLGKSIDSNVEYSGKKIAEKFNDLDPEGIKNSLKILKEADPTIIPEIQKYVLEDAFKKAQAGKGQYGSSSPTPSFNGKKFLEAFPDDKKFEALFEGAKIPQELKDTIHAFDRIERLGARKGGSPTISRASKGVLSEVYNFSKNPIGFVLDKVTSVAKDPEVVSEILLNPKRRDKAIINQLKIEDLEAAHPSFGQRTARRILGF